MTQYRLRPGVSLYLRDSNDGASSSVGDWTLERWVEPREGLWVTRPGYWSYIRSVPANEVGALKAHLAQPVQYFSGSP